MWAAYWPSSLALIGIQMVGLVSPGPDFAVVVRNSLVYSRKSGLLTATGIALGTMVHLTYILLGVGILIEITPWLFHLFKYVAAGYLLYMGIEGLRTKKSVVEYGSLRHHKEISSFAALRAGFLTSMLNPKTMLYFLSIISVFVTPKEPRAIILTYGIVIFVTDILWFSFVALCFSHTYMRTLFSEVHHWVERATGALLILLGVGMLFVESL